MNYGSESLQSFGVNQICKNKIGIDVVFVIDTTFANSCNKWQENSCIAKVIKLELKCP